MKDDDMYSLFTKDVLDKIFPADRAGRFFEAMLGDPEDGSFDISLRFKGYYPEQNRLDFEFLLTERPGKCLACNLTYGLPEVFSRHPVIDVRGLTKNIEAILNGKAVCDGWKLGRTREESRKRHIIPLNLSLKSE